ncbi:MAG: hypothetical protein CVV25_13220, partial [Ignavibacteriae bacterium HGW-Ignavibacteriae-4]
MKITSIIIAFTFALSISFASELTELYKKNQTPTYTELIAHYQQLADTYGSARLMEYGKSDSGEPIYLFVISHSGIFDADSIQAAGLATVLINNAIHPGEPCGVDASAKLAEDLLAEGVIPNTRVVTCIIPAYNVGGMLNRGCCSRANQDGPEEYGFRGNAKNLDLNRDFIKADAENTKTFYKIYHDWKPQIFVDAHSTNGADYPADMTLINTARSRVEESMRTFFNSSMTNSLYRDMIKSGYSISPYYHTYGDTITDGLMEYMDSPRYSTGYTTLFNTMGYVSEAHMLKPYPVRVDATYAFLKAVVFYAQLNSSAILSIYNNANNNIRKVKEYGINYKLDTTTNLELKFESYRKKYRTSSVTGLPIHYFDQSIRDTNTIPYYADYKPEKMIQVPQYYVLPQAWSAVKERLDLSQIEYRTLTKDTTMQVELYYISKYETSDRPYEGHYFHYNTEVIKDTQEVTLRAGDMIILTDQDGIRYIIESLEPEAEDSFFSWGFFDSMLQQKEWFSDYVFEPKAEKILAENPKLKADFEQKKKDDKEFAASSW